MEEPTFKTDQAWRQIVYLVEISESWFTGHWDWLEEKDDDIDDDDDDDNNDTDTHSHSSTYRTTHFLDRRLQFSLCVT